MLTHKEIIELLSLTTNKLDKHMEYGAGDVVTMIVASLKEEWGITN